MELFLTLVLAPYVFVARVWGVLWEVCDDVRSVACRDLRA